MLKVNKKINIILSSIFMILLTVSLYIRNSINYIITKKVEYLDNERCNDVRDLIQKYWKYIYILVPSLIVVTIVISYAKAVMASDPDMLKKTNSSALTRVIAGVVLILLPFVIKFIFDIFGIEFCI